MDLEEQEKDNDVGGINERGDSSKFTTKEAARK